MNYYIHCNKELKQELHIMKDDIYGEAEIIKKRNIIAKVYSPVLTDKERDKRMAAIKQASVSLILSQKSSNNLYSR